MDNATRATTVRTLRAAAAVIAGRVDRLRTSISEFDVAPGGAPIAGWADYEPGYLEPDSFYSWNPNRLPRGELLVDISTMLGDESDESDFAPPLLVEYEDDLLEAVGKYLGIKRIGASITWSDNGWHPNRAVDSSGDVLTRSYQLTVPSKVTGALKKRVAEYKKAVRQRDKDLKAALKEVPSWDNIAREKVYDLFESDEAIAQRFEAMPLP